MLRELNDNSAWAALLPRRCCRSVLYFTVNVNARVLLTSEAPVVAPVGDATAVTVTVDVPDGVLYALTLLLQLVIPATAASSTHPATARVNNLRRALRLLAEPSRSRPSRMPLHHGKPVGVTTGG
jgi:hypothetical protein